MFTLLKKKGVKYLMMTNGKVMKGDLGLIYTLTAGRRWRKLDGLGYDGRSIKRLGFLVKRPLANVKTF